MDNLDNKESLKIKGRTSAIGIFFVAITTTFSLLLDFLIFVDLYDALKNLASLTGEGLNFKFLLWFFIGVTFKFTIAAAFVFIMLKLDKLEPNQFCEVVVNESEPEPNSEFQD